MLKTLKIAAAAGVLFLGSSTMVLAKTTTTVPTVAGPCSEAWASDAIGFTAYYPLPHPMGNVGVNMHMNMTTGVPTLDSACIPAGWTVTGGSVTDGIQLSFSYLGKSAIDFKYVLGKTDIRFR